MKISFAMIWDLLNMEYSGLETPIYDSYEVRGIKMLPSEGQPKDDCIYLGRSDEGIVICCGGRRDILKTSLSLEELLNTLQDIFNRLRDWDMETHIALIEGEEPQRLLNLSEGIICNPITFMDPAFKLLAITSHERSGSPVFDRVRELGYLPGDTVEFYRMKGYMDSIIASGDETACLSENTCVSVIYPLRVCGAVAGFLSMPCVNRPYSQGLSECFRYLAQGISLCMERLLHTSDIDRYMFEYLLIDILDRKLKSSEELAGRLRYIDLPEKGDFVLLLLNCAENYASVSRYISSKVAELLPGDKVFVYKDSILVLLRKKRLETALEALSNFLRERNFRCGVSREFHSLTELPSAYTQAGAAVSLGLRIAENAALQRLEAEKENGEKCVYSYDDYARYHMLESAAKEGLISPCIKKLVQRDMDEGSDHIRVLRGFLLCERRPTQTAAYLHMHRNNVIYRIDRIESMLGISLEDSRLRQELEMSLSVLELIGVSAIGQNAQ